MHLVRMGLLIAENALGNDIFSPYRFPAHGDSRLMILLMIRYHVRFWTCVIIAVCTLLVWRIAQACSQPQPIEQAQSSLQNAVMMVGFGVYAWASLITVLFFITTIPIFPIWVMMLGSLTLMIALSWVYRGVVTATQVELRFFLKVSLNNLSAMQKIGALCDDKQSQEDLFLCFSYHEHRPICITLQKFNDLPWIAYEMYVMPQAGRQWCDAWIQRAPLACKLDALCSLLWMTDPNNETLVMYHFYTTRAQKYWCSALLGIREPTSRDDIMIQIEPMLPEYKALAVSLLMHGDIDPETSFYLHALLA